MKKNCILLLTIICFANSAYAEEIKLDDNKTFLEKNVNLESSEDEREQLMQGLPKKLENNGFILQNSISPVNGVYYRSNSMPDANRPSVKKD